MFVEVLGEVTVKIWDMRWESNTDNKEVLFRSRWWGEKGHGALFIINKQGPCCVTFPVRCPPETLANYFQGLFIRFPPFSITNF